MVMLYNRDSVLNQRVGTKGWREFEKIRAEGLGTGELLERVAQTTPELASAYILYYCDENDCEDWNELRKDHICDWTKVFGMAGFGTNEDFMLFWRLSYDDDEDEVFLRLSIDGATKVKGRVRPGGHPLLPIPSKHWWIGAKES